MAATKAQLYFVTYTTPSGSQATLRMSVPEGTKYRRVVRAAERVVVEASDSSDAEVIGVVLEGAGDIWHDDATPPESS